MEEEEDDEEVAAADEEDDDDHGWQQKTVRKIFLALFQPRPKALRKRLRLLLFPATNARL